MLHRWSSGLVCLALIAGLAQNSFAQDEKKDGPRRGGFFGRGGPRGFGEDILGLAMRKEVQELIKVNDEEKGFLGLLAEDIKEQDDKFRASLEGLEDGERFSKFREHSQKRTQEVESQLTEVLKEDKVKRLKQIQMQIAGLGAVFSPQVSEKLAITEEQRKQFGEKMMPQGGGNLREQFQALEGKSDEERQKFFADFRKQIEKRVEEAVNSILTDDQKSKFKEMLGEPINPELIEKLKPQGPFGRGPGGPGGERRRRDRDAPKEKA